MSDIDEVRTVTVDGRLIVPWVIQRALGLAHGGPVRFRVDKGTVIMQAVESHDPKARRAAEAQRGPDDVRRELASELNELLAISERNLPSE